MKKILLFIIIIFIYFSCSSASKRLTYEQNDLKNQAADNTKMANQFVGKYEYDKAIEYLKDSLKLNIMADNIGGVITNYADIGKVYLFTKDTEKALDFYNTALKLANEENINGIFNREKAYVLNGIGEAYFFNDKYKEAEEFFNKALQLEIDEESKALINVNIAKIYTQRNDHSKSLEYLSQALPIFEKLYQQKRIENIRNLSSTYYFVARKNFRLQNNDKAIEYIKKAIEIDKKIENSSGIADDYYIMAKITQRKDKNLALKYYNKSRDIYKLIDDMDGYILSSNLMAEVLYLQEKFEEFYQIKKEIFLLSKQDQKLSIAKEILSILDNPNALKELTDEEITEIKEKYTNIK